MQAADAPDVASVIKFMGARISSPIVFPELRDRICRSPEIDARLAS
jgi:hypothetical protein